jgi:isoquinoline 1-oxidoreductase beta subunit
VVNVKVMPTDNPPGGIGEVGLPPLAPALANAIARLTGGKRLRNLPFPEQVA